MRNALWFLALAALLVACEAPTNPVPAAPGNDSKEPAPVEEASPAYNIVFDGNGSDGGQAVPAQVGAPAQTVTLPANTYTKTGHEFDTWQIHFSSQPGWSTNLAPGQTFVMPETGSVQVVAVWNRLSYPVVYDLNGGTTRAGYAITLWDTQQHPYGSEVATAIAPTPPAGMFFSHWLVTYPDNSTQQKSQNGDLFTMPAGQVEVQAMYLPFLEGPIKGPIVRVLAAYH